jgi:hypothetical protein
VAAQFTQVTAWLSQAGGILQHTKTSPAVRDAGTGSGLRREQSLFRVITLSGAGEPLPRLSQFQGAAPLQLVCTSSVAALGNELRLRVGLAASRSSTLKTSRASSTEGRCPSAFNGRDVAATYGDDARVADPSTEQPIETALVVAHGVRGRAAVQSIAVAVATNPFPDLPPSADPPVTEILAKYG